MLAWSRDFDLNLWDTLSADLVAVLAPERVIGRPGEGVLGLPDCCCAAAARVNRCEPELVLAALCGDLDSIPASVQRVGVCALLPQDRTVGAASAVFSWKQFHLGDDTLYTTFGRLDESSNSTEKKRYKET